ncbi:MAG: putative T7SS-secreted protein [Cellulomonas sp.]
MSVWSLATTTDPEALVSGSARAVRRDADDLGAQAADLEAIAGTVSARTVSKWQGMAADEYARRRGELRDQLEAVAWVYRLAADALRSYAEVLSWGQDRAQVAVDLWTRGSARTQQHVRDTGALVPILPSSATRTAMTSPPDPGLALREQAEAVLDDARSVVSAASRSVAALLDQLSDGMPDGRWHAGSFAAGIWSWLTGLVASVWDFSVLRVVIDPDGAATSAVAVWDSTTSTYRLLTTDPLGAPDILLGGQARRDDPGRWWGELAPDIALTAVAGAGAATRIVSGMRAGMRTATAAERVTIGRTGFTAEDLARRTPGDGPVTFDLPERWTALQVRNALEHVDIANAARLEGFLSPEGRVSTMGTLRDEASLAARLERERAAAAGEPYGQQVAGHGPDTTWSGQPEPWQWQRQDGSVNSSFGRQAQNYPIGWRPTVFEGRLPDGTIVRGSWDWSPQ